MSNTIPTYGEPWIGNDSLEAPGRWFVQISHSNIVDQSKYLTNVGLVYTWADYISKVASDRTPAYTEQNSIYFESRAWAERALEEYLANLEPVWTNI